MHHRSSIGPDGRPLDGSVDSRRPGYTSAMNTSMRNPRIWLLLALIVVAIVVVALLVSSGGGSGAGSGGGGY
jgi:hypothetical protein